MRKLKLVIEYDGTRFAGWQYQDNGLSVQEAVERALSELLQESVRVTGAGRTDAGVHARGQIAHCEVANAMEERKVYRGVNALLPEDVVVHWVEEVAESFHARFSAKGRRYTYYISQTPAALNRNWRWFVGHKLDLAVMQDCANQVVGDHDFQAFCKVATDVKHYRCEVTKAMWLKDKADVLFDITANRFLYGMVRALVGTMVEIGRGYRHYDDFEKILLSRDRRNAGMAAPPQGLVLEEVFY